MVNYKLLLVWGFLFIIASHMVDPQTLTSVGFSIFIIFVHVAYGRLQTLASVGLSVFYRFCSHRMVDYRFSLVWGLLRLTPIIKYLFWYSWLCTDGDKICNIFVYIITSFVILIGYVITLQLSHHPFCYPETSHAKET